jgi:hypothetical protein
VVVCRPPTSSPRRLRRSATPQPICRFTFGIRGQAGRARHHGGGLIVFGMALPITIGSLASIHTLVNPTPHQLELGVLVAANLAATVLRFILWRTWVFHPNR